MYSGCFVDISFLQAGVILMYVLCAMCYITSGMHYIYLHYLLKRSDNSLSWSECEGLYSYTLSSY